MKDFIGFCAWGVLVWCMTLLLAEPAFYPYAMVYAEVVCEDNGGVRFIEQGYNRFATVYCKNGGEFDYNPADIRKEYDK